eukprot:TRINITY_DN17092_c0_g1_i2.p1 TRINITY_DN17092_c0_g1~~TRINITY_DN17092_c0_g1_i2.p1  ORF type:complete len:747 (-),score=120.10 TRINITY_DN17092_c0_g1_i2:302-2542(-)
MKPRSHQLECVRHVIQRNTIVNMPTGTGKTLVAVLTIDHFRESGKVMFLVPTRALVTQQAEYVRKHASRAVAVAELQGVQTDHLTATEWKDIVAKHDVLVGTAEVFRKALVDNKFLNLGDFSLLIFDECHNATGGSAMAGLLRDSVHRWSGLGPRILGLTASYANGALVNMEKKRKELERLLQATILCPDVEERPMDFERVEYTQTVCASMEQAVEGEIQRIVGLAEQCGVMIKDAKDVIRRGAHVFSELGMAAFIYFLRECVVPQVHARIQQRAEVLPSAPRRMPCLSRLRDSMRTAADQLSQDGSLTSFPFVTAKAETLLKLIQQLHRQGGIQKRIIIFCEQTVLAHPLAHLVQEGTGCVVGTCTGVGSMTDGQREKNLQDFRDGTVPMLTCTAAVEEGLDVSECEVVVRFSQFQTTKSHIQGSGRARAWNAQVFYFDNEPSRELAGAALMERTAKDLSLSLSPDELQQSRAHKDIQGVHPFHTSCGAEISIFNGLQIVYEYVARTLGASFRPEEGILKYATHLVCDFPPQYQKTLVAVSVPSPDGFFEVQADTVDAWWKGVGLEDVAEQSRMRNWTAEDRELRRFMFVVAVILSQKSFLDEHNQPSADALHETRQRCKAWQMSPGVRIGVRYDPSGLKTSASSPQPTAAQASSRAMGTSQGAKYGMAEDVNNYKGMLNQVTKDGCQFATTEVPGGFQCTVHLPGGRSFSSSGTKSKKKAAEQSAAEAALKALGHLPGPYPAGS